MHRFALTTTGLLGLVFFSIQSVAAPTAADKQKEALQELNEFIGKWNGSGGPPLGRPAKPGDTWKESLDWGWKFGKGGESWLVFEIQDGKYFSEGALHYDPEDDQYMLTVKDAEGKEKVFKGEMTRGTLTLFHDDAATKDRERLQLSTNNRGARFVYEYSVQKGGRGIFSRQFQVAHSKEGVNLAAGNKKECVVTGGLGTMAVSYKGKTYYVCCSGCRDAFNENPEKIIAEYEAMKK